MNITTFRSNPEATRGYSHRITLTHEDLTETTANTAQSITIATLPKGTVVKGAAIHLLTPFEDASDSNYNTTALIIGDSGDDDRYLASTQINANGTSVPVAASPGANVPFGLAAATDIVAKFASMSGKKLSDLDVGQVDIYLDTAFLPSLT